ncbi:hypothetical protein ACFRJ1_02880 [Streptomyces sp. NPDC056773]|uniref:hypothetical protein n=1 Tax=unclassified Streptomyces TaxID=2593676 RepID=UPI0036BCF5B1
MLCLLAQQPWLGGTVGGYTAVGDWGGATWRASCQALAGLAGALGALPLWSHDRATYRVFSWLLLAAHLLVLAYARLTLLVLGQHEGCVKDDFGTPLRRPVTRQDSLRICRRPDKLGRRPGDNRR